MSKKIEIKFSLKKTKEVIQVKTKRTKNLKAARYTYIEKVGQVIHAQTGRDTGIQHVTEARQQGPSVCHMPLLKEKTLMLSDACCITLLCPP